MSSNSGIKIKGTENNYTVYCNYSFTSEDNSKAFT